MAKLRSGVWLRDSDIALRQWEVIRESLPETKGGAYDEIRFALAELGRPLRNAGATQADCAAEFGTTAEHVDCLFFRNEHFELTCIAHSTNYMSSSLNAQEVSLLNMKPLADRLRAALEDSGFNQSELARRVGVSRGAVSLWLNGSTTSLTGDNLLKVASVLGVSANWLASGRGKMKPASAQEIPLTDNPDYPAIRRVRIKISAGITGFGIEPLDEDHAPIVFHKNWYLGNGYDPEKLLAIKVQGASMEPGMFEGDWVVVNTADTAPRDGVAFALNYDGEVVVKRLFRDDAEWIAASDNPDKRIYRDRHMNGDSFIIGRIVHKQSERI